MVYEKYILLLNGAYIDMPNFFFFKSYLFRNNPHETHQHVYKVTSQDLFLSLRKIPMRNQITDDWQRRDSGGTGMPELWFTQWLDPAWHKAEKQIKTDRRSNPRPVPAHTPSLSSHSSSPFSQFSPADIYYISPSLTPFPFHSF